MALQCGLWVFSQWKESCYAFKSIFSRKCPFLPHNRAIWQRKDIGNYFPDRGRKLAFVATLFFCFTHIGNYFPDRGRKRCSGHSIPLCGWNIGNYFPDRGRKHCFALDIHVNQVDIGNYFPDRGRKPPAPDRSCIRRLYRKLLPR